MDPELGIPGLGTYAAAGWGGAPTTEPTYTPPSAEASMPSLTRSAVPGTSGAPGGYTPSATPGGVSTGAGTGTAGTPGGAPSASPGTWLSSLFGGQGAGSMPGNLAGAGSTPPRGLTPLQRALMQMGGRMMMPPGNPMRPGAPAPQLSQAGQNPLLAQIQRLYGVDPETAMHLLAMMQPGGGSAMNPAQQSQMYYGQTFPSQPQITTPPASLLPSSAMPTPQNPYGVPRQGSPYSAMSLPPLGQGAFMPPSGANPNAQSPYGSIA